MRNLADPAGERMTANRIFRRLTQAAEELFYRDLRPDRARELGISLEISRDEWFVLRAEFDWHQLATHFGPEGTELQFHRYPLVVR